MKKILNIIKALIIFEILIVIALIGITLINSFVGLALFIIIISIIPIFCTIILYKAIKDLAPRERISEKKLKIYHQYCYNEFIVLYNKLINYDFDDIKCQREYLKKSKITFFTIQVVSVLLMCAFCVLYLLQGYNERNLYILAFILVIPYTLITMFYKGKIDNMQTKYNIEYKDKIISLIVNNYNNKFSYIPYIDLKNDYETFDNLILTYEKSKIVDPYINIEMLDDYIIYENDDYSMKIFNAYYDGKKASNKTNVFAEIITKSSSNDEIVLVPKKLQEDELNYLPKKLEKIEFDDEEFNKYFDIYSKTKNVKILNPDIIKELKMAYEITPNGFNLRIVENKIYLNFQTQDMFDDNVFSKFLDEKNLIEQYCLLDSIYKLANIISKEIIKENNKKNN